MKFLAVFTPENPTPPTPEQMAAMGELVCEMMKSGRLLDTGGLEPLSNGIALRSKSGAVSKIDGPFAESKEVMAGYAILQGDSLEEVVKSCSRFFDLAGDGTSEIRPISEGC
jgi:hypothetical protein